MQEDPASPDDENHAEKKPSKQRSVADVRADARDKAGIEKESDAGVENKSGVADETKNGAGDKKKSVVFVSQPDLAVVETLEEQAEEHDCPDDEQDKAPDVEAPDVEAPDGETRDDAAPDDEARDDEAIAVGDNAGSEEIDDSCKRMGSAEFDALLCIDMEEDEPNETEASGDANVVAPSSKKRQSAKSKDRNKRSVSFSAAAQELTDMGLDLEDLKDDEEDPPEITRAHSVPVGSSTTKHRNTIAIVADAAKDKQKRGTVTAASAVDKLRRISRKSVTTNAETSQEQPQQPQQRRKTVGSADAESLTKRKSLAAKAGKQKTGEDDELAAEPGGQRKSRTAKKSSTAPAASPILGSPYDSNDSQPSVREGRRQAIHEDPQSSVGRIQEAMAKRQMYSSAKSFLEEHNKEEANADDGDDPSDAKSHSTFSAVGHAMKEAAHAALMKRNIAAVFNSISVAPELCEKVAKSVRALMNEKDWDQLLNELGTLLQEVEEKLQEHPGDKDLGKLIFNLRFSMRSLETQLSAAGELEKHLNEMKESEDNGDDPEDRWQMVMQGQDLLRDVKRSGCDFLEMMSFLGSPAQELRSTSPDIDEDRRKASKSEGPAASALLEAHTERAGAKLLLQNIPEDKLEELKGAAWNILHAPEVIVRELEANWKEMANEDLIDLGASEEEIPKMVAALRNEAWVDDAALAMEELKLPTEGPARALQEFIEVLEPTLEREHPQAKFPAITRSKFSDEAREAYRRSTFIEPPPQLRGKAFLEERRQAEEEEQRELNRAMSEYYSPGESSDEASSSDSERKDSVERRSSDSRRTASRDENGKPRRLKRRSRSSVSSGSSAEPYCDDVLRTSTQGSIRSKGSRGSSHVSHQEEAEIVAMKGHLMAALAELVEQIRDRWVSLEQASEFLSSCGGDVGGSGRIGMQTMHAALQEHGYPRSCAEICVLFQALGVTCTEYCTLAPSEFAQLSDVKEWVTSDADSVRDAVGMLRALQVRRVLMEHFTSAEKLLCRVYVLSTHPDIDSQDGNFDLSVPLLSALDPCVAALRGPGAKVFANAVLSALGLRIFTGVVTSHGKFSHGRLIAKTTIEIISESLSLRGDAFATATDLDATFGSKASERTASVLGSSFSTSTATRLHGPLSARNSERHTHTRTKFIEPGEFERYLVVHLWRPLQLAFDPDASLPPSAMHPDLLDAIFSLLRRARILSTIVGPAALKLSSHVIAILKQLNSSGPSTAALRRALDDLDLLANSHEVLEGPADGHGDDVHTLVALLGGGYLFRAQLGPLPQPSKLAKRSEAVLCKWRTERAKLMARWPKFERLQALTKFEALKKAIVAVEKDGYVTDWKTTALEASSGRGSCAGASRSLVEFGAASFNSTLMPMVGLAPPVALNAQDAPQASEAGNGPVASEPSLSEDLEKDLTQEDLADSALDNRRLHICEDDDDVRQEELDLLDISPTPCSEVVAETDFRLDQGSIEEEMFLRLARRWKLAQEEQILPENNTSLYQTVRATAPTPRTPTQRPVSTCSAPEAWPPAASPLPPRPGSSLALPSATARGLTRGMKRSSAPTPTAFSPTGVGGRCGGKPRQQSASGSSPSQALPPLFRQAVTAS